MKLLKFLKSKKKAIRLVMEQSDSKGNVILRKYATADGRILKREYDNNGNNIASYMKDKEGVECISIETDTGTTFCTQFPDNEFSIRKRDKNGNITYYRDSHSCKYQTFDSKNNLIQYSDDSGVTIYNTYDDSGRVINLSVITSLKQKFNYNEDGTLSSIVNSNGYIYDADGRITQEPDPVTIDWRNFRDED